MRKILYVPLIVLLASQSIMAAEKTPDPNDPNDPKKLMEVKWNALASILQNKDLKLEVKEKRIDKIIDPLFDFPRMAKLSLGKTHWPELTKPQQEKFTKLFIALLKKTYREKINLYTDEKLTVKPAVKKTKNTVEVPTELMYKDKKIVMVYKLHNLEKRWKIYDVEIQGVSILRTYMSQFDDILRNGTVEDLLSKLEKPPSK